MRPSPARSSAASSVEGTWSSACCAPGWLAGFCRLFSEGLFAALAEPLVSERERTRLPSQKASNRPSNRSQSALRAENRCLKAERSRPGFSAKPEIISAAASCPSLRPTAKALSRSVFRKAASLAET